MGAFRQDRVRTEIKGRSAQTYSCSRDSICGRVSENHWVFRTACVCVPSLPAGDEETKKARKGPTVGWQWVSSGFSSGQVSIPNPSQCGGATWRNALWRGDLMSWVVID